MRKTSHSVQLTCDRCGDTAPTTMRTNFDDAWEMVALAGWGYLDGSMMGKPGPNLDICPSCVGHMRGWFRHGPGSPEPKPDQQFDIPTGSELKASIEELLLLAGYSNMSNEDLAREAALGNGAAPALLRARHLLRVGGKP